MSDLISRQAAIDAIYGITAYKGTIPLGSAIFNINKIPAAQPEKRTGERTETHDVCLDTISRQQAINVIERMRAYIGHNMERAVGAAFIEILDDVGKDIGRLPSIQFATDTNVGTKLGTNLAEVGTDCISRQAAIDTIMGQPPEAHYPSWYAAQIKELPTAEPKRGKWIHHPEIGWGETWLCDQCGEKTTSTVMGKPRANFCPNCGADMREVTT